MQLKDLFDGFEPDLHKEEAKARYGEKYEESLRRTSKYTRQDWEAMKLDSKRIMDSIVSNMAKGPAHPDVLDLISLHRGHITRWFYDCTPEIYRGLADLYVQDPRFTASFERIKPGLAEFMNRAMINYCVSLSGK